MRSGRQQTRRSPPLVTHNFGDRNYDDDDDEDNNNNNYDDDNDVDANYNYRRRSVHDKSDRARYGDNSTPLAASSSSSTSSSRGRSSSSPPPPFEYDEIAAEMEQLVRACTTVEQKIKLIGDKNDSINFRIELTKQLDEAQQSVRELDSVLNSRSTGSNARVQKLLKDFKPIAERLKSLRKQAESSQKKHPLVLFATEQQLQQLQQVDNDSQHAEASLEQLQNLGFRPITAEDIKKIESTDERKIQEILREFTELGGMFQVTAQEVEHQQDAINEVDQNVDVAKAAASRGQKNLAKAATLATVGGVLGLTIIGVLGGAVVIGTGGAALGVGAVIAGASAGVIASASVGAIAVAGVGGASVGAITGMTAGGLGAAAIGKARKDVQDRINDPTQPFKAVVPKKFIALSPGQRFDGKVGFGRTFAVDVHSEQRLIFEVRSGKGSKPCIVRAWNNDYEAQTNAQEVEDRHHLIILDNSPEQHNSDGGADEDIIMPQLPLYDGRWFFEIVGTERIATTYIEVTLLVGYDVRSTFKADRVLELLYENNRRVLGKFSSSFLLPGDRAHWSDAVGDPQPSLNDFKLPSSRWSWETPEWTLVMDADTDKEGWQYAFDWKTESWDRRNGGITAVRRRKWTRWRTRVEEHE